MKIEDIKVGMNVFFKGGYGIDKGVGKVSGKKEGDPALVCIVLPKTEVWVALSDITPYNEQYTCNIPGVTVELVPGKEYWVSDYSVREAVCDPIRGKYICTIKGRHYMEMDEHSVCGWKYAVDPDLYKEPETEMTVEEIAEALRKSGAIKGKLRIKE